MNTKNDEQVLKLWNKVKEKQKEILTVEKPKWETSCTIGRNPDSTTDRINIQTVTDIKKLVDIYVFLNLQSDYWSKANTELGLNLVFNWMGSGIQAWKNDIKSRIAQINLITKRKELEVLEQRLNSLISMEQRRELELAEISKLIE